MTQQAKSLHSRWQIGFSSISLPFAKLFFKNKIKKGLLRSGSRRFDLFILELDRPSRLVLLFLILNIFNIFLKYGTDLVEL